MVFALIALAVEQQNTVLPAVPADMKLVVLVALLLAVLVVLAVYYMQEEHVMQVVLQGKLLELLLIQIPDLSMH